MASDSDGAPLIGRRIGVYQLQSLIGVGGMGEGYRAHDTKLGRDVAIKILPHALTAHSERRARFEREARLLAALNHPNIATIHGVEETDGLRALVLELVEGETLAQKLAEAKTGLPLVDALNFSRQIADALEAAHERGITHRDLKPANVKVTPGGTVKLLDFGLAKAAAGDVSGPDLSQSPTVTAAGTRDGVVLGTAAYMSPEQARGKPIDKRTDIWAFGCVLYELLTGRTAFAGETISDTVANILGREPDWSRLPEATPPIIRRLLLRCLVKDAKGRLHDIADARIEIDEALDARAAGSFANGLSSVTGTRRRRWSELRTWIVAAALGGLLVWMAYSKRPSGEPAVVELSVLPARGTTFPSGSGAPWPSVSPDGSQLAFVALTSNGQQQLWIRPLDSAVARPLQGTDGAMRPFWSPSSRSIAYFANGKLWRVEVAGGSPRAICDAPYSGDLAGAWGDEVIVFSGAGGLRRVSADGGPTTIVVPQTDALNVQTPSFLPDGRHLLYQASPVQGANTQVCVASLDAPDRTCVLNVKSPIIYAPPGYLVFVSTGTLKAQRFDATRLEVSGEPIAIAAAEINVEPAYNPAPFSASDNGVLAYHSSPAEARLAWLDRSGAVLSAVGIGGQLALSKDEKRIIVRRRDVQTGNTDLWLSDRSRGTESRFTFDPFPDAWPAFSPDGERVVFASSRNGVQGLYQKLTSGAGGEEVLLSGSGVNPDWSSDGRFILYQAADPKTDWDLWAVPLSGDRKPFPVARTEHGEREGRLSPDVSWVAYDSTESGRRDVWVQPFPPTGSKWQISSGGGVSPRWRGDGKELFYVTADGMLTATEIAAGSTLEWSSPRALFQTMFRGGAYAIYAVSKDGQRFLMNVPPGVEDIPPITVVVNWTAALKK